MDEKEQGKDRLTWWINLSVTNKLLAGMFMIITTLYTGRQFSDYQYSNEVESLELKLELQRKATEAAQTKANDCQVDCLREQVIVVTEALRKQEELNAKSAVANIEQEKENKELRNAAKLSGILARKLNKGIQKL